MLPSYKPGEASAYASRQGWQFKTAGDNIALANCPLCSRSGYKFYINDQTGLWIDHHGSCGRQGNWFQLMREMGDAQPSTRAIFQTPATVTKKTYRPLSDFASYEEALASDEKAQAYLTERGITMDTARAWHFGVKTEQGKDWLMMPYLVSGDQIADVKYRTMPPAEKGFKRMGGGDSILYGEHTLDGIPYQDRDVLWIVEGEIDAVTLWQHGYRPVVSTTAGAGAFKPRWFDLILAHNPKTIYICYDSDVAGQKGAANLLQKFDDRVVKNIVLPTKDANEFFQTHTKEDFDKLLVDVVEAELPGCLSMSAVLDQLEMELFMSESGFNGIESQFPEINDLIGGGYWKGFMVSLSGVGGIGKAQPLDTPVLTPTGFRRMGDLAVGDSVIGSNGQPTRITGTFDQGSLPIYTVTADDGASTECCGEHLWLTQNNTERTKKRKGTPRSTRDLMALLSGGRKGCQYLPIADPVEFAAQPSPALHPYVLGVLLGDGCLVAGSVLFDNPERDIQQKVEGLLPPEHRLVIREDKLTCCIRSTKSGGQPRCNEVRTQLESLGLNGQYSYQKHVPPSYLTGSIPDRIQLLHGLLDTDGSVAVTSVEYTTSSDQLADDVVFLVRSLGGTVTRTSRFPKYSHNGEHRTGRLSHRLMIGFDSDIVPVSSKKHLARYKVRTKYPTSRRIASIVPAGTKECRCIKVAAADQLYVTENFLVTHNTSFALQELFWAANHGHPTQIICLEMPETMMMRKLLEHRFHIDKLKLNVDDVQGFRADLEPAPLYLGSRVKNVDDLEKLIRASHKRYGIEMLAFDNINYFVRSQNSQTQEIGIVSKLLKELAVELNMTIVCVAQPTKFDSSDRLMTQNDIKDSSSIVQDSDVVMLLSRRTNATTAKTFGKKAGIVGNYHPEALLRVAKARYAPGGETILYFHGDISTYRSLTPEEKETLAHANQ